MESTNVKRTRSQKSYYRLSARGDQTARVSDVAMATADPVQLEPYSQIALRRE